MKTYYAILEVNEQASADEIRRAYRRLVLLTHPDRTPDPTQHRRYLTINEAYETLSAPARRQRYDAMLARQRQPPPPINFANIPLPPDPTLQREEYWRNWMNSQPKRPPLRIRYAAQLQWILSLFRKVAYASLLCVLLITIDFNRTETLPNEKVQRVQTVTSRSRPGSWFYFSVYTQRTTFNVNSTIELAIGDRVIVQRTPWFGKVKDVIIYSGSMQGNSLKIRNFDTMWGLATVVTGSALLVLYLKIRPDRAFNLGFINSVAALVMLVYLLFV